MTVAIPDEQLEAVRRRAFGIAYRMLGTVSEAEDVAQEAMLRFTRGKEPIREPTAWITTTATRLSIDVLGSARARRETYVGPWLPEPVVGDAAPDPAAQAELADSLSQAFLVILERLTPVERAAFLLREVFGYDYPQIAEIVDRNEANTRQLVTRAKKHLEAERPRFDPDEELRDKLLERSLAAAQEGDVEALEAMLAEDAVFDSDGGGKDLRCPEAAFGARRIARVMAKLASKRRRWGPFDLELVRVNGQPGRIRGRTTGRSGTYCP